LTEFVEMLDASEIITTKDYHYIATWFNLTIFEKLKVYEIFYNKLKLLFRGS
jgi:hypothetical protein